MADKRTAAEVAIVPHDPATKALIVKSQAIPAETVEQALILTTIAQDPVTGAILIAGDFGDSSAIEDNTAHREGDGSDHADVAANTSAAALNTTHRGLTNNPHSTTFSQVGAIPGLGINSGSSSTSTGLVASMAQGSYARASGNHGSFAQGVNVEAAGHYGSFSQGNDASAYGPNGTFAQGQHATAFGGNGCFAQGQHVSATGYGGCFAQGIGDTAYSYATVEATGYKGCFAQGGGGYEENSGTTASGNNGCFAQGVYATASGYSGCFAQGNKVSAQFGGGGFAQGYYCTAYGGYGSFAQGNNVYATQGNGCFAQGAGNSYYSYAAVEASGYGGCFAQGEAYSADDSGCTASGYHGCFAQGQYCTASGNDGCFAQGKNATAIADTSWQIGAGVNATSNTINIQDFVLGAGANVAGSQHISIRSSLIDFEVVTDQDMFTVPTGFDFLIDSFEVYTISGTPGSPATVRFGIGGGDDFQVAIQTTSNAPKVRHIFDSPEVGQPATTDISAGVTVASNAAHTGYFIYNGYLVKI